MTPKQADVDRVLAQLEPRCLTTRERVIAWRLKQQQSTATWPIVTGGSGARVLDVDRTLRQADGGYLVGKR